MQKQDREILKIFQTEDNRKIEEDFASMLSENPNLRLFFINENQAYTDGKNIERGLKIREKYMELTCMIWFDGLITCTTKMDLVFLIHVTLGFLVE